MVCEYAARKARRQNPDISETAVRRAVELLRAGEPINRLAGFGPDGKYVKGTFVVRPERFKAFCLSHPKFGAPMMKLIKHNSIIALTEVRRKGNAANAARFAPRTWLRTEDHVPRIRAAVASLPLEIRDDVFQNIALAILDRRVSPEQIEQCVTIPKRRTIACSANTSRSSAVSCVLQTKVFDDGPTTLGDTVTRGLLDSRSA